MKSERMPVLMSVHTSVHTLIPVSMHMSKLMSTRMSKHVSTDMSRRRRGRASAEPEDATAVCTHGVYSTFLATFRGMPTANAEG